MKNFILISVFAIGGFGFSQSIDKYNVKKISFELKHSVIDSAEWKKGMQALYGDLQPMSDMLFEGLGLEREESMPSFDEFMDTIQKSIDIPESKQRFFVYENINDSIIKRYESTPRHIYASGPTYLNLKSGKVYGDYPYKHFHRIYEYEFEKAGNVIVEEYRDTFKLIEGVKCFKVKLSYTYLMKEMYRANFKDDEFFSEFEAFLKDREITMEMWVTEKIKSSYHPILKVKEAAEKYYPLEIEMKSSDSKGMLFHYVISELILNNAVE